MFASDKEVRLLGFARLWRLSRLHETLVSSERERTAAARKTATAEQERSLRVEVERARLEGVVAENSNARARLEKMCRAFKDEIGSPPASFLFFFDRMTRPVVDTLNEALVIAARDIAETADSEFESEDDDAEDDEAVEAYRPAPAELLPKKKKKKAPPAATKFVVDPSGAYKATA